MSETIQISTLFLNNLLIELEAIELRIQLKMFATAQIWTHNLCIATKQQLTITQQPPTISMPTKLSNNITLIAMLEGIEASLQMVMFENAHIWTQRLVTQIKDLITSN